jgi:hypothetical protein
MIMAIEEIHLNRGVRGNPAIGGFGTRAGRCFHRTWIEEK